MDEIVNFDFSGKSKEEVLLLFFHEIKSHVNSVTGYLTILDKAELPDENAREFTTIALKRAQYVHDMMRQVFEYIDEQGGS